MAKASRSVLVVCSILASAALATAVTAQNLNGTLASGFYGSALSVQTINTGFGDSTVGDGTSAGGSEMDAAYGKISGGNLYLFLSGNSENNGNHWNVFVGSSDVAGQSTLNVSGGWTGSAINGSTFSPGFTPNLFLDANNSSGTLYTDEYLLNGGGSANTYLGAIPLTGGIGNGTLSGITLALNDTNAGGVNGATGTAANPAAALAVSTGLELAIPLSVIGNPSGAVMVMAEINGGGDGYLSNQFLPGLPVGSGNVGNTPDQFNFGSTAGEFFVVVPEPSSIALVGVGLLGAFGLIRRRKV